MTYLPSDRIRVFVSSRLGECEKERLIAREVIESLGHEPIMFEGAGARSYAPRSVYLRGLEESQVFIGIYREGYGYIAENMEISGLEDEYRFAKSLGIPQLLYVLRNGEMEPRLKVLVDEFTVPSITVGYFDDPVDLELRIRNDLVALVSDYFTRGTSYAQSLPSHPTVVTDALVPPSGRLRREKVEDELEAKLEDNPMVLVRGPLGCGKTVFLSALCGDRCWAFVECGEKPLQDVLVDSANAIRSLLGLPAKAFLLPKEALAALRVAWNTSQSITLVLDDVRHKEILDQIRSVAPVSQSRRLIFSSRTDVPMAASVYEMPPLDLNETRLFVERNREEPLMAGELVELQGASKGNPLYLRYYLSGQPREYETNLAEYEARVWRSLGPRARELLYYLAWSDRPLSLDDLSHLFSGSGGSIEELADELLSASSLLAQSDRGYTFFHPHAKATVQSLTNRSQSNLRFYIERLRKWFFESHDYVSAYNSLNSAGFSTSANLLELAGRQAIVKGDYRMAVEILEVQIDLARSSSDKTLERDLTLYMGYVVSLSGKPDQALEIINRAADIEAPTSPPFDIEEVKSTIGALGLGDRQAFSKLVATQEKYRSDGSLWDVARLCVDLSVYYVRQNDAERAAGEAKFAMEVFKEHGDDYGFRIARGNYLSAIATFPGKEKERDNLIREMESESEEEPRQRALLCNVLARRARKKNNIASAKAFAIEAIEIGRNIGDNAIVCNNLMNLGNSYRAEENWESAIAQYEAADKLARESKLILIEASAQELLASAFNGKGDGERAVHHANYAISIVRGLSYRIESNATEELAKALELMNREDDAREAWLRHASLVMEGSGDVEAGSFGFYRAVSLIIDRRDVEEYVNAYSNLFGVESSKHEELSLGERLVGDLPDVVDKVSLEWTFEAAVHHTRLMFENIPDALVRRVFFCVNAKSIWLMRYEDQRIKATSYCVGFVHGSTARHFNTFGHRRRRRNYSEST